MFKKLKEMRRITAAAREGSISLRRRMMLYWISMAVAVIAALMIVLSFAGVFSGSSEKLRESLTLQQQNTVYSLTEHLDALEAQCISLSRQISGKLTDTLVTHNKKFEDLNNNEKLIVELEDELYTLLSTTLQSSNCNGAFFLMDATCNTEAANSLNSRMGVYLRYSDLSSVNMSNKHMVYFRGASEIARKEEIQMHNRWNLEFDTGLIPGYESMIEEKGGRLADECVWTRRVDLKDTWEDVTLLCVPIKDMDGKRVGVCGIEISELYFRLTYPAAKGPYGNMMIALTPFEDNILFLDDAMKGGTADSTMEVSGEFKAVTGKYYNTYQKGLKHYIGLHDILPVTMSDGRKAAAVTFMSDVIFQKAERNERLIFMAGFGILFVAMLILSGFLTRHFVTPIAQILEMVRQDQPLDGQRSGIEEIDELMQYICQREKNINQDEHSLPPNIEELFCTFTERVSTLTPMERTVLQYYIEGCSIDEVAQKSFISINTVKKHNTNINRKLGVTSRDELMLYIDLFRRCERIEEITYRD